ncbi:MAG: hypothetical protein EA397_04265 [Deltaproteobacteria bacterium]|nr:MAG: hypothetical protein EA397_04265 [Deltaproteobacteria bacterium]
MRPTRLARALLPKGPLSPTRIGPVVHRAALVDKDPAPYAAWMHAPVDPPPLTWLYPWVQPMHLAALLDPALRIPVLGMVHAGNVIARTAALPRRPRAVLELAETDPIAGRRALLLRTLIYGESGPGAAMLSTYLLRAKAPKELDGPSRSPTFDTSWPEEAPARTWPRDAGRAYAHISGDYNPIHLAAPLARLFGQRGAILHGMAMAAAAWHDTGAEASYQDLTFRRPLVLPGTTRTHYDPPSGRFAILGDDGTTHARGEHGDHDRAQALIDALTHDLGGI